MTGSLANWDNSLRLCRHVARAARKHTVTHVYVDHKAFGRVLLTSWVRSFPTSALWLRWEWWSDGWVWCSGGWTWRRTATYLLTLIFISIVHEFFTCCGTGAVGQLFRGLFRLKKIVLSSELPNTGVDLLLNKIGCGQFGNVKLKQRGAPALASRGADLLCRRAKGFTGYLLKLASGYITSCQVPVVHLMNESSLEWVMVAFMQLPASVHLRPPTCE